MKKRTVFCTIAVVLLLSFGLSACEAKEEPVDAKYKIYHVNTEGTALLEVAYTKEIGDANKAVRDMIGRLKVSDDAKEGQPSIPKGVELLDMVLEDEKLSLYFNEAYGKMNVVQEVLCRAALVRTLTQIEGVDLVSIYVDGNPLANQDGEVYGYFQAEDFVQNTGSSINSFQETELTLYFAGKKGDTLVPKKVRVRYNSNTSKERLIVEKLMKGVGEEFLQTIPKGTKLLGVSLKDGVCYLNFDEGLQNAAVGVKPEIIIYSIVNSVTESGAAGRVQIAINGDSNIMYQNSVDLKKPLSRNLDIVEEE
ncbi:GerMN domain-containing protein [Roseburia hominis]